MPVKWKMGIVFWSRGSTNSYLYSLSTSRVFHHPISYYWFYRDVNECCNQSLHIISCSGSSCHSFSFLRPQPFAFHPPDFTKVSHSGSYQKILQRRFCFFYNHFANSWFAVWPFYLVLSSRLDYTSCSFSEDSLHQKPL